MRKTLLLLAVLSLIIIMTACAPPEEVTISKYFGAMQVNDRDTMGTMAYEPRDVEFTEYEILSIEDPAIKELALPGLVKKLADLTKQHKDQVMKAIDKAEELEDLQIELEETRSSRKKRELNEKLEQIAVESEDEKKKVKSLQLEINKTKKELDAEKALITLSTAMRDNLDMFTGETQTNKVTVKITLESGEVKDYIFLLRKDTLRLEDREQKGRLVIIKLMTSEEYEQYINPPAAPEEVAEEAPAEDKAEGEEAKAEEGQSGNG